MTLHLHRAARTDSLAEALGDLLAQPPDDVFAPDLVLVPARGTERWLSQRLSHRLGTGEAGRGDGVCAGVELRTPRSLVAELTDTVAEDPWAPDALAWPVLAVLDRSLEEPWARTLAEHLGHGRTGEEAELRRGRRYAVARRLAGLLASYAAQRPGLLEEWSTAGDASGVGDGAGGALPRDLAWQVPLWRAVVEQVGAPTPAQRHRAALERLRRAPTHLPARLSLFGHTRMPVTEIELLGALATHHDLHLWLPHPSEALWESLAEQLAGQLAGTARRAAGGRGGAVARREDSGHHAAEHPLLATLGRDVRELQRALTGLATDPGDPPGGAGSPGRDPAVGVEVREHRHESPPLPDTLLGWLQADLRANAVRPAGRTLRQGDRSVQVHAAHGPARQVDVLREVLLGLLADDETLEPRDVLVMCPDIETYAPLVVAGFGLGEVVAGGHPAHGLRVRLADRSLTQTNPLLGVAARLLDLAGGRAPASAVLDLTQAPPVRRRFAIDDDDLETITAWVRESGVRWGLDQEARAPYGLEGFVQNTWRFGLDRVLAGVAISGDAQAWVATTLPLDDVGSNRVDLAGRLAELVERLGVALRELSGPQPLRGWLEALGRAVAALTRVDRAEAWQSGQVQRELAAVLEDAGARAEVPLRLADVRALLGDHLAGRPTRANFRTGTLTVCTMTPMRSVPHRVVCLLGLDDGVFPRQRAVDGDDVLARTPLTGERDPRSEDRQLLLDAIGAATETLVLTYTGADEHTGRRRPPSVPLGEVLDALDRTTTAPVRDQVCLGHPLQPFDPRSAEPGRLGADGPFTFDPAVLGAARALVGERTEPPPFLAEPLPAPDPQADVALADLVAFVRDPVRGFFRALDVAVPWEAEGVEDAMPVEIDALATWGVGERMLADMMRGVHPDRALAAEWRRGSLPPGQLGWRQAKQVREQAMALARAALTHRQVAPQAHDVDVTLRDGRRLTGTVTPVHGDRLVAVGFSRLGGRHLVESWVRLLALAAHAPDANWTALSIGRGPGRGTAPAERLLGPAAEEPQALLEDLVALYDAGRREPLPLPVKTSFAWAEARRRGEDPVEAARRQWRSQRWDNEDAAPAHVRVWGPRAPLEALLGPVPPGEEVPGEDTRLGALAARLWLPMLRCETTR